MASQGIPGYLRYRVVETFNAGNVEITSDLPHPHTSTWTVTAFQPGNPSNSTLGSFTIPLFPPGSDQYMAAKPIYDQLDLGHRVEGYISGDGASLGKLKFAGIIRGIEKAAGEGGDLLQLTGTTDLVWANGSLHFPGELFSNGKTSAMLKSYLGTNEISAGSDAFSPFVSGNYTSTSTPGNTAGTWTGTTDDGFNVVTCSTGTQAVLISKTGAAANDRWHTQFVECQGRLSPSADGTKAGTLGVGISSSSANANNCIIGYVTAHLNNGRYSLDANIQMYSGGVLQVGYTTLNALSNVDDPEVMIPVTLGLLCTTGGNSNGTINASFTVNGKVVIGQFGSNYDPGTVTQYPLLSFGTPNSGTAVPYLTNLVQMTRYTTDGPATAAVFANGTISTATHSLGWGADPGPAFLDAWSKLATREGWYWRYTPQPYVVGTRTLGTVDFAADPGTDRSTSCIFRRRLGNLLSLRLIGNADAFASGTQASGLSSPDGGGLGFWRDINTMNKYGVLEDLSLALIATDFNSLRRHAYQITANKTTIGSAGAKTVVVLRDAETVDRWRELDKVLIDDPDLGINNLVARVIGYTFTEGDPRQTMHLDQFSEQWVG